MGFDILRRACSLKIPVQDPPNLVNSPIFTNTSCKPTWLCEPLFPLTAFKNAPNPKFVQNSSRQLSFGAPISGTQKLAENSKFCPEIVVFQFFDKFLTNLGPPDWNPEKQSSGRILDKFGVRGVFECCKGKGSQPTWLCTHC